MAESQGKVVALAIVLMILPLVTVALRIWTKVMRKASMTPDDYMILLALVFTLGTGACQLVAGFSGNLGQHLTYSVSEVPDQLEQLVLFLKAEYAFEILAQLAIVCAKLSLILLYRRIFINVAFQRASWIVGTTVVVWHGAFFLAFIFQCTPVNAIWDLTIVSPKCVNKIVLWEAYAISDVLTDTLILSMPIPAVLKLQMAVKRKVAVSFVFLLGAIVIASGITRTAFFFAIAKEPASDITYTAAPTMYWSFIETSLGTVCACIPTLRPIFARESIGSLVEKLRSLMALRSSGSNGTDDLTPNGSLPRVHGNSNFATSGKDDFYSARANYIDSQPLLDVPGSRKHLREGRILVSSEIRQSHS